MTLAARLALPTIAIALASALCGQNITITGSFGAVYPNGTLFQSGQSPTSSPQVEAWVDPSSGAFPKPVLSFYATGTDPTHSGVSIDSNNYTFAWSFNSTFKDRCKSSGSAPNPCPGGTGFINETYPDEVDLAGGANYNPNIINSSYGGQVTVRVSVYYTPGQGGTSTCGTNYIGSARLDVDVAGVTQTKPQTNAAVGTSVPWFVGQIIADESGGNQFLNLYHGSAWWPVWGAPDGYGTMQIDRTQLPGDYGGTGDGDPVAYDQDPYWNYVKNIADGIALITEDRGSAASKWYEAMHHMCTDPNQDDSGYTNGNTACNDGHGVAVSTATELPDAQIPGSVFAERCANVGPAPVLATNVPFEFNASGQPQGSLPIVDADWILAYNGFAAGPFMDYAAGTGWFLNYPFVTSANTHDDYVMDVCKQQPD